MEGKIEFRGLLAAAVIMSEGCDFALAISLPFRDACKCFGLSKTPPSC